MGNVANAARIAIVVVSAALAIGSATSNSSPPPQGYYPRPQGQTAPAAAPAYNQPQQAQSGIQPQAQYSPCEYACGQVSRCNLATYDTCLAECRKRGTEQQPGGPDQLGAISRSSCPQLQAMMQTGQQPQQAAQPGQRQWSCSATGAWQRCDNDGVGCSQQSASAMGVGATEPLARGAAESQCNSYMGGMMSANFAYRTSVVGACRSISCTPP